MKIYAVGGSVRDALLGLPVQDRDFVVVGATPEQMIAAGYTPVGKDFPVFLHPLTHEEYALARTERKTAPGYKGFVFHTEDNVTLEEDLARRDLTINAIAQAEDGSLIDPFGGQADIAAKVFRHVSPAFAEDPVRILRVARFAARFPAFTVASETNRLMQQMADGGEVDALVPERVWQEIARGLMEERPSRMVEVLRACGALRRILPELDALWCVPPLPEQRTCSSGDDNGCSKNKDLEEGEKLCAATGSRTRETDLGCLVEPETCAGTHVTFALDYAAKRGADLPVRFAVMLDDIGKGMTHSSQLRTHPGDEERGVVALISICERLKVPSECRDLAVLAARFHMVTHRAMALDASHIVELLQQLDAFRRPERFEEFLQVCEADARAGAEREEAPYPQAERLRRSLAAARAVNAGAIAAIAKEKALIPERIYAARVVAVADALTQ